MAPQVGSYIYIYIYIKYTILVNFDQPDGSTGWVYITYDILVQSSSPDGSTNFGNIY